uniref:Anaphase-promoting complex subunit 4 n=3 Tax=Schistocephalus solidus TaxID=70667 RepID=A0A0X3PAM4_SCHSO
MAHSYITSLSTSPFLISGGLNVTLPLVEQLICRIRLTTFHPSMPWLYLQMRYLTTKRSFSCLKHFSIRIQSMLNAILGFLVFRLSVLLVYLDGCIRLFGCGVYEIARVDTNSFNRTFLQSFLAADLSSLYHLTTTTDKNSCLELQLHKLDTRPLSTLRRPLKHLSFHISALLHCKQILLWSLKQLKNAWENTLLELDTKLTAYARERLHASASWSLRNELLEIILFGHISSAFQKFLATEWTSNSIRRAGVTMLKAYESMKAITFQQLQFGLMRLIFEASEFLGFARNRYHYHLFNISETTILHLIRDAGATLQKAQELHLVVEHCSQYLRPFFKWLYGVAVTSTKIDSDKNAQKITSQERDLIINFVTEKLRPLIVDGELKSYQIELVEQYIRNGRVTKSVDEIFGIHPQSEHFKRSKLKDLIPLPDDLESEIIPDGVFKPTNCSLADLIEETLASQIDLIASASWHDNPPCSLLSADPETVCLTSDLPHPSSNPPSAPLLLRVCSSTCQPIPDQFDSSSPSSPDLPSGTTACSNKIAVVRLSNPPTAQSDSILLYTFDRTDSFANWSVSCSCFFHVLCPFS